jgi:hypothetical protein
MVWLTAVAFPIGIRARFSMIAPMIFASRTEKIRNLHFPFFLLFAAAMISTVVLVQVLFIFKVGDQPSPLPSAFSEANRIRAGEYYADHGFLKNAGLPNVAYGNAFRHLGATELEDLTEANEYIYTRYPPGPDWMTGLATIIFGKGEIMKYRIFPMAVSVLAMIALLLALQNNLGRMRSLLFFGLLVATPMFTYTMHNLHISAYGLSLLYFSWALYLFRAPGLPGWGASVLFFLLGFLQGWVSYDLCFLMTFSPLVLFFLKQESLSLSVFFNRALLPVLLLGSGFTLAFLLHVVQVVVYMGSWQGAYEELFQALAYRSIGDSAGLPRGEYWTHEISIDTNRLGLIGDYLAEEMPRGYYLGFNPSALFLAVGVGTLFFQRPFAFRVLNYEIRIQAGWKMSVALFASFLIACLWILFMFQHAFIHTNYIPRHFILPLFTLLAVFFYSVKGRRAPPL